jgi:hypothetical protein
MFVVVPDRAGIEWLEANGQGARPTVLIEQIEVAGQYGPTPTGVRQQGLSLMRCQ